ncbi:hypothetical protein ACE10Z_04095 [Bradyrhizobium sp. Pha-3]|uniref:hypothetical protein n=1 Tax=Bradyrhizobium sp. Pha-3 TaxID=208375 RepID=UPI0035D456FF
MKLDSGRLIVDEHQFAQGLAAFASDRFLIGKIHRTSSISLEISSRHWCEFACAVLAPSLSFLLGLSDPDNPVGGCGSRRLFCSGLLPRLRGFTRLPLGLEAVEVVVERLLVGEVLLHRLRRVLLALLITNLALLGSKIHTTSN